MRKLVLMAGLALWSAALMAQAPAAPTQNANNRFEQLGPILPTPNTFRTASGAPGKDYFQNRADYDIKVELDDANQKIIGTETVTYHNNSTDELPFIWLQLDQNLFAKGSTGSVTRTGGVNESGMSFAQLQNLTSVRERSSQQASDKYGYKIISVKDAKSGTALKYTINQTMMRVDLPMAIKPGGTYSFNVDWNYFVTEYYGRSGMEFFAKDGNYNYFIAHWFPRLCAYNDVNGWQNKQFLGQGEFTLIFGNYKVAITAPADHIVGATGECQNYKQVLSATQQKRLAQAATSKKPVVIVTQEEAEAALKTKPGDKVSKKTWVFDAKNVRDFAFTSSRRFIWDAMQTDVYGDGRKIWSMSYYAKEGNPLWGQYSTRVVEHTLKSYGNRTIKYPYPVAISCHATAGGGMEYPMISFNGGRPEADGTLFRADESRDDWGDHPRSGPQLLPDDRQLRRAPVDLDGRRAKHILPVSGREGMGLQLPKSPGRTAVHRRLHEIGQSGTVSDHDISDNVIGLGPNAYAKPATALNILRETVMGRELFDYAFKEYARRWAFKSPEPADFFRTLEDASGVDLDWFWRGWFYGVEPVDQDLVEVDWFQVDAGNPEVTKAAARAEAKRRAGTISKQRDAATQAETVVAKDSTMKDFYNNYDPYAVTDADKKKYQDYLATLSADERKTLEANAATNFYTLSLKNKGGLPMPVIIRMQFEDGTDSVARFPAEIWRFNDIAIKKVIATPKKVTQWILDPYQEIADIDTENNAFPGWLNLPDSNCLSNSSGVVAQRQIRCSSRSEPLNRPLRRVAVRIK